MDTSRVYYNFLEFFQKWFPKIILFRHHFRKSSLRNRWCSFSASSYVPLSTHLQHQFISYWWVSSWRSYHFCRDPWRFPCISFWWFWQLPRSGKPPQGKAPMKVYKIPQCTWYWSPSLRNIAWWNTYQSESTLSCWISSLVPLFFHICVLLRFHRLFHPTFSSPLDWYGRPWMLEWEG